MRRNGVLMVGVLLAALLTPGMSRAQEDTGSHERTESTAGPERAALREAMRTYFQNRMREALGLTDDQMAELSPRLERITEAEAETRRERTATLRRLRNGLKGGASDSELQRLLDHWEKLERDRQESERQTLSEIDRSLTVRQRIQLRFFIQGFRTEMRDRIRDLRGPQGRRDRDSRRPGRRRP